MVGCRVVSGHELICTPHHHQYITTINTQDVAVREAESVELQGDRVDEADTGSDGLNPRQAGVLRWAADTYMQVRGSVSI